MPDVLPSGIWPGIECGLRVRKQQTDAVHQGTMKNLLLLLLLLLVYLQYQLWFGDGSLQDVWELHQDVELQRLENIELRERNAALQAEVTDLQQGLDAIEEHAREDLGMVKKGETFYQVVE
jgi:cell division protein FtsB